ncbi:hypothetical protein [Mesoterricola silvestris]|uniref:Uncharacterized protein n=1 Tax=Mesoterricola silvestris TaxID=2927979 RepID=A0AA48GJN5_9BACT|nr:hypothetical protein [Mesoterricola silvestris]BDU72399.1 hypothetical protein METEAL_15730 [Mesoterricola silvestris]
MDLSKVKAVDSVIVKPDHPALLGVEITLAGAVHPATKKAERDRADAMVKGRKIARGDEREAIQNAYIAARIIGWTGIEWEGEALPYSPENALMLVSNPNLAILREAIVAEMGNDEVFFKV